MKYSLTILLVAAVSITMASSAQSFLNLDFESANLTGYPPHSSDVPVGNGFPGWTVSSFQPGSGTQINSTVGYDLVSLGGAEVSINDSQTGGGFTPIQGNFSAYLFGGDFQQSVSISQTGVVPNTAESIQMDIGTGVYIQPIGPFTVALNGQTISMIPLETFSSYTLYGGNIGSFAGETATLDITALPGNPNPILLDDIVFSSSSTPEPGTWTLLLFGAGLLGVARCAKRNFQV